MANYAVIDWVSATGSAVEVMALMETYLETVDDAKTIIVSGLLPIGSDQCQGYILHDA